MSARSAHAPPKFDRATLRAIPPSIWALGFVSMLMDVSSEMIHALLPVYLITVLATSATTVGVIEGIAESTAAVTKVFSGVLSDWIGKRKVLAVLGYGLAAFTKPVFPLATTVGWMMAARFVDRIGKGIRGAPRDALVADLAPAHLRGACFGLRQTLDTVGAFLGPLLAILIMWSSANRFRVVFWLAVPPAFLAMLLIIFAVREPERAGTTRHPRFPLHRDELGRLGLRVLVGSGHRGRVFPGPVQRSVSGPARKRSRITPRTGPVSTGRNELGVRLRAPTLPACFPTGAIVDAY